MLFSTALLAVGVVLSVAATTVLYGYLVAVLRASASADPTPPRFEGWTTLLVEGALAFVVWVVYLAPVVVPGALYAGWLYVSGATSPDGGSTAAALFLLALVASVGVLVASYYLAPAALANYVHVGRVRAAFDLRTVVDAATTKEYVFGWGLAAVVYLVLGTVAGILQFLLVGFLVYFYVVVVMTYLCGRGFADALGVGGSAGDPPDATPTPARDG